LLSFFCLFPDSASKRPSASEINTCRQFFSFLHPNQNPGWWSWASSDVSMNPALLFLKQHSATEFTAPFAIPIVHRSWPYVCTAAHIFRCLPWRQLSHLSSSFLPCVYLCISFTNQAKSIYGRDEVQGL
jgi:hypothetical protein